MTQLLLDSVHGAVQLKTPDRQVEQALLESSTKKKIAPSSHFSYIPPPTSSIVKEICHFLSGIFERNRTVSTHKLAG